MFLSLDTKKTPKHLKYRPVIKNLRDLASGLVGAIAAQAAGAEGKGNSIRALHGSHASVPIGCAAAIVTQTDSVFHIFLQEQQGVKSESVLKFSLRMI